MLDPRTATRTASVKWPTLTPFGFDDPRERGFASRRAEMANAVFLSEVVLALAWLAHVPNGAHSFDSYFVKHVVEDWASSYVSNGAMIAAATATGFRVEQCPGSLNAVFGLASQRYWPFGAGQRFEFIRQRYKNRVEAIPPTFITA